MVDVSGMKERFRKLKETAGARLKGADASPLARLKNAKLPEHLKDVEKLAEFPAKMLERERERAGFWLSLYIGFMALLVFLNLFMRPGHPHFGVDGWFGFWPVFGLGVGLVMVFVMKRIVQPLIVRKEDYYDDL